MRSATIMASIDQPLASPVSFRLLSIVCRFAGVKMQPPWMNRLLFRGRRGVASWSCRGWETGTRVLTRRNFDGGLGVAFDAAILRPGLWAYVSQADLELRRRER